MRHQKAKSAYKVENDRGLLKMNKLCFLFFIIIGLQAAPPLLKDSDNVEIPVDSPDGDKPPEIPPVEADEEKDNKIDEVRQQLAQNKIKSAEITQRQEDARNAENGEKQDFDWIQKSHPASSMKTNVQNFSTQSVPEPEQLSQLGNGTFEKKIDGIIEKQNGQSEFELEKKSMQVKTQEGLNQTDETAKKENNTEEKKVAESESKPNDFKQETVMPKVEENYKDEIKNENYSSGSNEDLEKIAKPTTTFITTRSSTTNTTEQQVSTPLPTIDYKGGYNEDADDDYKYKITLPPKETEYEKNEDEMNNEEKSKLEYSTSEAKQYNQYNGNQQFEPPNIEDPEDDGVIWFVILAMLVGVGFYVAYHNRKKIFGLMLEGRNLNQRTHNGRRYRQLSTNDNETNMIY